jgi:hypothetical protein
MAQFFPDFLIFVFWISLLGHLNLMEKCFTCPFYPFKHQKSQFFCTMSFSSFWVFFQGFNVSVCDDQRSSFFTTVRAMVNEMMQDNDE